MRALIINNGARHPASILRMLIDFTCTIMSVTDITPTTSTSSYDLVVFTGSSQRPIAYSEGELTSVLTWITNLTVPALGICYGAQLIATAFGATLKMVPVKHRGFYTLVLTPENSWSLPSRLCLYEAHQWQIDTVAQPLSPLIESPRGTLLFEHNIKPIVGMQFHPEKHLEETDGQSLFTAFLKRVGLYQSRF